MGIRTKPSEAREKRQRESLSLLERRLIGLIAQWQRDHHVTPTHDFIASELSVAQPTVSRLVRRLEERGYLVRVGRQRAIRLLRAGTPVVTTGVAGVLDDTDPDRPRIDGIEALIGGEPDLFLKLEGARIFAIRRERDATPDGIVAVRAGDTVVLSQAGEREQTARTIGAVMGEIVTMGASGVSSAGPNRQQTRAAATQPSGTERTNARDARAPTPAQIRVIECLRDFRRKHTFPPTRSQAAKALGIRRQSLDGHIGRLIRRGLLAETGATHRSLRLTCEGAPLVTVGELERLQKYDTGVTRIASVATLLGEEPDLFVRVGHQAPPDERLGEGDLVAIVRGRKPRRGDLIAVREGDTVELRRAGAQEAGRRAAARAGRETIGVAIGAVIGRRRPVGPTGPATQAGEAEASAER